MREKAETNSEPIRDVRASDGAAWVRLGLQEAVTEIELGVHDLNWGGMPVKDKRGCRTGRGSLRPPCSSTPEKGAWVGPEWVDGACPW